MTLEEFQSSGDHVKSWRAVLELPITKTVLEIMQRQNPVNLPTKVEISPHLAHIVQGQQEGYALYHNTLTETLLQQQKAFEHIEQTYEPAEE